MQEAQAWGVACLSLSLPSLLPSGPAVFLLLLESSGVLPEADLWWLSHPPGAPSNDGDTLRKFGEERVVWH